MQMLKFLCVTIIALVMIASSESYAAKTAKKEPVKSEETSVQNSFEGREYDIGLSIGMWMGGTIDIEGVDVDKDPGLLFRAFADSYLMPNFAVGAYFNYSPVTISFGNASVDGDTYELGVALKPRFMASPVLAVKPGLNIGYRKGSIESWSADMDSEIDGLGLNLSVEFQYMMQNGYILLFEGGFLSQPTGGNDDASVTWAPIIYLSIGMVF